MGLAMRFFAPVLVGFALMGACVPSGFVDLGSNVEAGGVQGVTPTSDDAESVSPSSEDSAADGSASSAADSAAEVSSPSAEDSAVEASTGLCLGNPLFTGIPTDGGIPPGTGPSTLLNDWQICAPRVDVNPGVCTLQAPPGSTTYLGMQAFPLLQNATATSVSTALVNALPPGNYAFSIELALAVTTLRGGFGFAGAGPAGLAIYGSTTPCGRDERLWQQPISNVDSWSTYSVTFTATRGFSNLVLVPVPMSASGGPAAAGAYVIVANLVSQTCD
jgi:hypothetical protein